jgi:hypothetical protein
VTKWTGNAAAMGEMGNAYKLLTRKPNAKKLSGRPRCIKEDNIKIDTKEIWWGMWNGFI